MGKENSTPLIIVLNGTSSSGKGNISEEYRKISDMTCVSFGMDLIFRCIYAKENIKSDQKKKSDFITYEENNVIHTDIKYGEEMVKLFKQIPKFGKEFLEEGFEVILDEVLLDNDTERVKYYYEILKEEIKNKRCIFVYITCNIEKKLERERLRGDRPIGLVSHQSKNIENNGISYDFVIDTSFDAPEDCAQKLHQFIINWKEKYL